MLGRNGNIAYVRYDSHGRIVPGGPILSRQRPRVGNWQPLSLVTGNSVTSNSLRAFVRIDAYGRVVASSLLLLSGAPSDADSGTSWLEINATYRPQFVPTTTTTSTSTSTSTTSTSTTLTPTTSTTTTADPLYYYLTNKYNCPDCSTIVESNFLIKGFNPVNIGDWVIRNPGTGFIAFQVLSVASPNPSAYLVDTGGSSSTCPCPITTTTTTSSTSTSTSTSTTTSPYKTFMFYSSISGDLPTICALSGTLSGPWYFIGPGTYPTVGDTIYWSPGFPYALNGAWMKIANGHAINGDANGYITQDAVC